MPLKDKAAKAAYYKQWYEDNRERQLAHKKHWCKANPDKIMKKTTEQATAAHKRWREKNPERYKQLKEKTQKRFREAHPNYNRQWKYGLTDERHAELLTKQHGLCPICREAKELCVDHNHTTDEVRGLLCRGCNVSIGQLGDTTERLRAALRYLQGYSMRANWPRVMLDIAMAAASRSRDSSTRVGAVICSENWRVLGTGYNGPPAHSPDSLPMAGPVKHAWVIHAEINALSQATATLGSNDLSTCQIFSTHRPCASCLKLISHHGIREATYDLDELSPEQVIEAETIALALGLRVTSSLTIHEPNTNG